MAEMKFVASDEPRVGPDVRRYSVACDHGASAVLLIPGSKPLADLVVLDLLLVGHHRRQGCQCIPAIPVLATAARA